MKRIFTLLLATSLLIGALSACGSSNPAPETEPAEEQSVQEETETLDTDTSTGKETIYAVFKESAIEAEPIGMIVSCISSDALINSLAAVKEAGIPLTCTDAGDNEEHYDALYMTDCYQAAWDLCEFTCELIDYKGSIYLLNAVAGVQSCEQREQGFRECAKQYPEVEIINEWQDCDNDKTMAANMTLDMLTARDDDISAIVGLNENALMGVATAVDERGLDGEIVITGVDCSEDVQAYIRQGVINGSSSQDPYKMGYLAVYGIQQILDGEDLNHQVIDTGCAIVTKENIDNPEIQAVINP